MTPTTRSVAHTNSPQSETEHLTIRAKPRFWELKGLENATIPDRKNRMEESFVVTIPPEVLEKQGTGFYTAVRAQIQAAFNEHHGYERMVQIGAIWAIWGDLANGGSFSRVYGFNLGAVLELVAKGSPWAHLVFDYQSTETETESW